jgi:hypothetical protein
VSAFMQVFLDLLFQFLVQLAAGFGRLDHWLRSWSIE